jgi:TatD DNase family protein
MIIDSHCHLTNEPMFSSLDETIKRANNDGVKYLLTISTEDKSFKNILDILENHNSVYGTYGIHPHEAKKHREIKSNNIIEKVKKNKKIIGIGETGLDFYYNHSEKKDQISSFLEHVDASQKTNLPLIVHTRSAEDDTFKILKQATQKENLKILIHCFTGTKEFAFKLLDIGAYISASGIVTFRKSKELAETFKKIPTNRILVETDSPYLAPEPFRGKSNEPSYITHTVKFLSDLKNISYKKFSDSTTQNFFNLFGELN